MKSLLICACTAFLAVAFTSPPTRATEIHVDSAVGKDTGSGSVDRPFQTVAKALEGRAPGDLLLLAPGIYRESLAVTAQGTKDRPIVIESADPAHPAILSGADPITEWKALAGSSLPEAKHPHAAEIFYADIPWVPTDLFVGARRQANARLPKTGYFTATACDGLTFSSDALKALAADSLDGAQAFFVITKGVRQEMANLKGWTAGRGGALAFENPLFKGDKVTYSPGADYFYLQNHLALLDQPGEWVTRKSGESARIFWWPLSRDALALAESPRRPKVVDFTRASFVTLRGVHVRHAARVATGYGVGSDTVNPDDKGNLRAGVVIEGCTIYQNERYGVNLSGMRDAVLRRCLVADNSYGATVYGSRQVVIEENEIAWNENDGLTITWNSDGALVRRNAIHHHSRFSHPDNFQTFRNVKNVTLDSNVLLAGGQGVHSDDTAPLVARNNFFIGCYANLFFTNKAVPGNAYTLERNTFALFPNGGILVYPEGHHFEGNLIDIRGGKYGIGGEVGPQAFTSVNNQYFAQGKGVKALVSLRIDNRKVFLNDLAKLQAIGLEVGSVIADPKFPGAPERVGRLDEGCIAQCTRTRLVLARDDGAELAVGNHLEVDFDGVDRRVTAVDGEAITIEPALAEAPVSGIAVLNWGAGPVRALDFRTAGGHGANLDFEAFLSGDFDGDGKRDVPPWPEGMSSPRRVLGK